MKTCTIRIFGYSSRYQDRIDIFTLRGIVGSYLLPDEWRYTKQGVYIELLHNHIYDNDVIIDKILHTCKRCGLQVEVK